MLIKHNAVQTYECVEVSSHALLTPVLEEGEFLPLPFYSWGKLLLLIGQKAGWTPELAQM